MVLEIGISESTIILVKEVIVLNYKDRTFMISGLWMLKAIPGASV